MSSNDIFLVNPYQSHPSLTPQETEVLWEYAKLAQNLRMVCFIDSIEKISIIESVKGHPEDPSSS
jgi:hypothetical protein